MIFEQLQRLIFEYLNFKPFLEEIESKMVNIRTHLDEDRGSIDTGKTTLVISNIACNRSGGYNMIYFSAINQTKMEIVKKLLETLNNRRESFGMFPNYGTYGFGSAEEVNFRKFGWTSVSYIGY